MLTAWVRDTESTRLGSPYVIDNIIGTRTHFYTFPLCKADTARCYDMTASS